MRRVLAGLYAPSVLLHEPIEMAKAPMQRVNSPSAPSQQFTHGCAARTVLLTWLLAITDPRNAFRSLTVSAAALLVLVSLLLQLLTAAIAVQAKPSHILRPIVRAAQKQSQDENVLRREINQRLLKRTRGLVINTFALGTFEFVSVTLLCYLVGLITRQEDRSFSRAFRAVAVAVVPLTLGFVAMYAVSTYVEVDTAPFTLRGLVRDESPLHAAASRIDIVRLWWAAALGIALAEAWGVSSTITVTVAVTVAIALMLAH